LNPGSDRPSGETPPHGAVLVAALLVRDQGLLEAAVCEIARFWGPVIRRSELLDFMFTDYYDAEMGSPLIRQFASFGTPHRPEELREWKVASNALEGRLAVDGRRRVNIDPGYLDMSKVVVASTKDATYRVFLGQGIYAQPMLRYEKGSFRPWPWTYPDYRTREAISFFNNVRADYRAGMQKGAP
jgi:hypothetical protein